MRALLAALLAATLLTADSGSRLVPLPDPGPFFSEVRKRLASNETIQSRFSYKERSTRLSLNPFGRMGTGPVTVYEVYPAVDSDLTYRRAIERDGQPVPPEDIAAADREHLRKYRDWQRRMAREGRTEREERLRREAAQRRTDEEQATEALGLLDFTIERRERHEGHPAVVVTFRPRPGAQPRTREGRVAGSFAGTVWIHEHEFEVMRLEARAVEDTTFGFGLLARLHEGATAVFERRRILDTWLPVESRFDGTGRALLFRKVEFHYLRQFFDYQPWDPSRLPEILGAAQGSR
ncbi:MAG: hypothetical protein AB1635_01390 [Acidobacteriota bacterium]